MIQGVQIIRRLHRPKLIHQSRRCFRQNKHNISPLLRFDSAVLRYPEELGLEADPATYLQNHDLLLESTDALQFNNNKKLQHLQNHWQQSASSHEHEPLHIDLNVYPNTECKSAGGGHILLGRNASGKSLTLKTLIHTLHSSEYSRQRNPYLHSGSLHIDKQSETMQKNSRYNQFLSHVSFESHSQLLSNPISVHRALIPGGGNRLSPTAQFLIVRLGMFPLLQRTVDTLSTGEIRRVLLVRALVTKPSLLLLDNVMDGLDVSGRQGVQNILERVLSGFRMDILVQGISAKDTARTQVLLSTLRHEEISDSFDRVTFIGVGRISTEDREQRSGVDLIRCLHQWSEDESSYDEFARSLDDTNGEGVRMSEICVYPKHKIPSTADINSFWETSKQKPHGEILVEASGLKVVRDDTVLLSDLNWTVQRGERWHLAGVNGAGKSTLGRLLLRASRSNDISEVNDATIADGSLKVTQQQGYHHFRRGGVGWVSTELHLHAARHWMDRSLLEILSVGAGTLFNLDKSNCHDSNIDSINEFIDIEMCSVVLQWLGVEKKSASPSTTDPMLLRKFGTLSQGEQKLLLLASAISQRPSLLILDEPCQGLDVWNRACVLGLIDAICKTTNMSLLYITHHEEELIDGIDKVLRLEQGQVVQCGAR